MVNIRVTGLAAVTGLLGRVAAAAMRVNGPIISLSSPLPYAFGIETGRHRGGRLARAAGGAHMARDGINAMRPRVAPALGAAVLRGPSAVDAAKRQLQAQAVEEVRKRTPVQTGALRDSWRPGGRTGGR